MHPISFAVLLLVGTSLQSHALNSQSAHENQTEIPPLQKSEGGKWELEQRPEGKILAPQASEPQFGGQLVDGVKNIVDLSHRLENSTLHWPKNNGFQYINVIQGEKTNERNETHHYKSDSFITATHTGTHLDAPIHFNKSVWSVDNIPLDRLVDVPLHVIDLSDKVKFNRSYNFIKEDFIDQATRKPMVTSKSVCLVYTGLSQLYKDGKEAYLGTNSTNISQMKIPGFSKEAAQYMVELGVYGVGLDAPSADSSERHGADESIDPIAHVILNSANIYILENVNENLAKLVKHDARMRLTVLPLAIVGGSGSPVRLVAVAAHDDCTYYKERNSSRSQFNGLQSAITAIVSLLFGCLLVSKCSVRPQLAN